MRTRPMGHCRFRLAFVAFALVVAAVLLLSACDIPTGSGPVSIGAGRAARIGVLAAGEEGSPSTLADSLRQGLREFGWQEGRNLFIEERRIGSTDTTAHSRAQATELVNANVDLIVVSGRTSTQGAMEATRSVPILFTNLRRPVEDGMVASLARPGGNLTGVSPGDLRPKALEMLKEAFPNTSRVAVVENLNDPQGTGPLAEATVQALGMRLIRMPISRGEELDAAFETALREGADAFFDSGNQLTNAHRDRLLGLVAQYRLPAIRHTEPREWTRQGGLMGLGEDASRQRARLVPMVDKILRGANPAELPVEQATEFELVVNLKTAQALGLTIPQSVLIQATEIIR